MKSDLNHLGDEDDDINLKPGLKSILEESVI
jgi:hypothetical protein